jgi:hypothetical protein
METGMSDHSKDPVEERAAIREQMSDEAGLADEEAADEATLAPPGHLGERMNEGERREKL